MKSASVIALSLAALLGGVALTSAPLLAQAQPQARTFTFSKEERAALLPLQTALAANNFAAAAAALPAAQAAARGADARYAVANYQLRIGIGTGNRQMQEQAIEAIIASGAAPAADLPQLYANQAAIALQNGKYEQAERSYARIIELTPNDADAVARLSEIKNDRGKTAEALTLLQRAISLREAAGRPAPQSWYKRAVKTAYDTRSPQSLALSRSLLAAYPDPQHWRDALLIHRDLAGVGPDGVLDILRLKRAARALHGERDYSDYATSFSGAGLALEAKAALDEGVAQRMVDPSKAMFKELIATTNRRATAERAKLKSLETAANAAATGAPALAAADAYLGAGDHARAADLYRAALQKGSVDAALANSRLGIALALAGRKAEAEAAFRAVTGPRAEVAALWLTWLARRA